MHQRQSKKIIFGLLALFAVMIVITLGHYLYVWLIKPEVSLTAKLQQYAQTNKCFRCHQPDGQVPTDKAKPSSHDLYYPKQDWQMFFQLLDMDQQAAQQAKHGHYNRNRLYQGEMLARKYNCFLCHGKFAQGGVENPGSLKGYIPGWFGTDFEHLTDNNNKTKIREWIMVGMNQDIINMPILGSYAQDIFERQQWNMIKLAYLDVNERELLVDYVSYMHELGELNPQTLAQYQTEVREYKQQGVEKITIGHLEHD